MNRIETSKGVLKYRNPSIIETISLIKILRKSLSDDDLIEAKLSIMENIDKLLDYSELNDVKNFDELNQHGEEMTGVLYSIADDILNKIVGAFAKKH